MTLEEIANAAAISAGKNACVAPELLYAHILWELQDAAEINRALNMPVDQLRKEVPDEQIEAASQVLKRALSGKNQSKDCDYPLCGCEDHFEPCRTSAITGKDGSAAS